MDWVVGQVAGLGALNDLMQNTDETDKMGGDDGICWRQAKGISNTMGGTVSGALIRLKLF